MNHIYLLLFNECNLNTISAIYRNMKLIENEIHLSKQIYDYVLLAATNIFYDNDI